TPAEPRDVWGGYYEPGSLIWRSRWVTSEAVIECREALAFPGDPGRIVLLRRVCAVGGEARMRVVLEPRAGFGRHGSHGLSLDDGVWSGTCGPLHWRWRGGPARADQRGRRHGRGGDDEPAGTGRPRPQLRLPVRLDPGPGLRRHRRGPGRRRGPAGRRDRIRHRPAAGRRPGAETGLHR